MVGKLSVPARVLEVGPAVIWLDGCELRILDGWLVGCPDGLSLPKSDGDSLRKFEVLGPVSYTHLTLPTIYSV